MLTSLSVSLPKFTKMTSSGNANCVTICNEVMPQGDEKFNYLQPVWQGEVQEIVVRPRYTYLQSTIRIVLTHPFSWKMKVSGNLMEICLTGLS